MNSNNTVGQEDVPILEKNLLDAPCVSHTAATTADSSPRVSHPHQEKAIPPKSWPIAQVGTKHC